MPKGVYRKTEEHKEKLSEANRGNLKLIESLKGRQFSEEHRKNIGKANTGGIRTEETRRKMSSAHRGVKNGNWNGGISGQKYPMEFNQRLKLSIRTRDKFICQICGRTEEEELEELNQVLSVNHIDFDKSNCSPENLNTLCLRCNLMVNWDREKWSNYFRVKSK